MNLNLYKRVRDQRIRFLLREIEACSQTIDRVTDQHLATIARAERAEAQRDALHDERGHDAAHAAQLERVLREIGADYACLPLLAHRVATALNAEADA